MEADWQKEMEGDAEVKARGEQWKNDAFAAADPNGTGIMTYDQLVVFAGKMDEYSDSHYGAHVGAKPEEY